MYKTPEMHESIIAVNNCTEGETIEDKVIRLIQNKEPVKDGTPIIFTEKSKGVGAAYNIRTDRWEIAVDAMDIISKIKTAKSDEIGQKADAKKENKEGETQPTGGIPI